MGAPGGFRAPTFRLREHYRRTLGIDEARGDTVDVARLSCGRFVVEYTKLARGTLPTLEIKGGIVE